MKQQAAQKLRNDIRNAAQIPAQIEDLQLNKAGEYSPALSQFKELAVTPTARKYRVVTLAAKVYQAVPKVSPKQLVVSAGYLAGATFAVVGFGFWFLAIHIYYVTSAALGAAASEAVRKARRSEQENKEPFRQMSVDVDTTSSGHKTVNIVNNVNVY